MEYRLNHKTGVIYSRDEYINIEMNWGVFRPAGLFEERWEDLEELPITTEEERKKLQFIYLDNIDPTIYRDNIHHEILRKQYNAHVSTEPVDLFDNFIPSRNNVGRAHFSRGQEAD